MTTEKPYLYGGIFFFLLSFVLLISAVAVPRFAVIGLPSFSLVGSAPTVSVDILIGAFQLCADVSGSSTSTCGTIDGSCAITGSNSGVSGPVPYCTTFNGFRVFLIIALVLAGLALLSALAHTCQASPQPYVAHFTFLSALFALVSAAISFVCWASFYDSFVALTKQELSGATSYNIVQGPSYSLLISALVFGLVAMATWLCGRSKQQQAMAGALAAVPHYHSAPTHYVEQGQLKQPLTQQ